MNNYIVVIEKLKKCGSHLISLVRTYQLQLDELGIIILHSFESHAFEQLSPQANFAFWEALEGTTPLGIEPNTNT